MVKKPNWGLFLTVVFCLSLWLGACSSNPTPVPVVPTPAVAVPSNSSVGQPLAVPTNTIVPTVAPTVIIAPTAPIASTATPVPTAVPAPIPTPASTGAVSGLKPSGEYKVNPCPMKELVDYVEEGKNLECGTLTVPEDQSKPGSTKTLKLAVAILKGTDATKHPPLFFLTGGPGQGAVDFYRGFAPSQKSNEKKLLDGRTMVFMDQRGTGYFKPTMKCPETEVAERKEYILPASPELEQEYLDAVTQCRDRLLNEGVNLAVFNSAQNAADFEALRLALKYPKVDLYGISYGSRLALTIMRDYPQGLRSVIITSIVPPQSDLLADIGPSFNNSLNELFKTCAADAACNKAYPNLKAYFERTYNQLNQSPITISVKDRSRGGQLLYARIDGPILVSLMYSMLFSGTFDVDFIPVVLYYIGRGYFELLGDFYGSAIQGQSGISDAMYYSVECSEDFSFTDYAKNKIASQGLMYPLQSYIQSTVSRLQKVCERWNVPKAPAYENQPVKSDVPTLIINGKYDPITPPKNGEDAAKTLTKSTLVTLPVAGHDPGSYSACGLELRLNFLADPTKPLDTKCVGQQKLNFELPDF